ncbi:hypothetical protein M2140_001243 [Clostridiales Family XIII bacterium PM5-7]
MMMKRRTTVILIICVTVVFSVMVQVALSHVGSRTHQHESAKVSDSDVTDPLTCINKTETSEIQYDASAVDTSELRTHLPIVTINTSEDIPGVPYYEDRTTHRTYTTSANGDDYVIGEVKVLDNANQYNTINDDPAVVTNAKVRVRGNSSRWFDKKSYSIKLVDEEENFKNLKIMGMEKNHDWALHGPFLDKSLMRNYLGMNISGQLMDYAPDVRYCEVVINGEYQGLYIMMETVNRGQGRVDIEQPNNTKNLTGYIVELDNRSIQPFTAAENFTKYTQVLRKTAFFNITYPGSDNLTPELRDYIEKDMSTFEKALYSFDYDKIRYGYKNFIDFDEFVNYLVVCEVFLQYDTGSLSTFFYKDVNGKFKPCVWDFNNSVENYSDALEDAAQLRGFVSLQSPWIWMMIKDEAFTEGIITRYKELRKGILSDEYLLNYIEDTRLYLGSAVKRNEAVWGYSFQPENLNRSNKLNPDDRNPNNMDEAVAQLKEGLLNRLSWLDENIDVLKQYSHESAVKKFND